MVLEAGMQKYATLEPVRRVLGVSCHSLNLAESDLD